MDVNVMCYLIDGIAGSCLLAYLFTTDDRVRDSSLLLWLIERIINKRS